MTEGQESLRTYLGSKDSTTGLVLFWLGGGGLLVSLVVGGQAWVNNESMGLTRNWLAVPIWSIATIFLAFTLKRPNPAQAVRMLGNVWLAIAVAAFAIFFWQEPADAEAAANSSSGFVARQYRPVRIGVNGPDLDACGSNGRVIGLNPKGDNFLAVKAAPDLNAPRTDRLGPGSELYICESSKDGKWLGVVYHPSRKTSSKCGVTSAVARVQAYSGPCKSGWVWSKNVDIYAG